MPNLTISVSSRRPFGRQWHGRRGLQSLITFLQAGLSGNNQTDAVFYTVNDSQAVDSQNIAGQALAAAVFASSSGTVGVVIDGTTVTVTWATSDTASMTALMAAILANTSVNRKVTATNKLAKMTLATVLVGTTVNVMGITFKAVSGTPANFGEFDISGNDTADALSLSLAINRHPALAGVCRAVSSAGAVYVGFVVDHNPNTSQILSLASATTITINTAVPAAGAVGFVLSAVPGAIGECCTITATGTNVSVVTANAGKLGHGIGGGSSLVRIVP